jgi:hypothetical protein
MTTSAGIGLFALNTCFNRRKFVKKKDLPRLELELIHYSSIYPRANIEGKVQLKQYIWKLKRAIANVAREYEQSKR